MEPHEPDPTADLNGREVDRRGDELDDDVNGAGMVGGEAPGELEEGGRVMCPCTSHGNMTTLSCSRSAWAMAIEV